MLVAASMECFRDLPFSDAVEKLADLEYTNLELAIHHDLEHQLTPAQVLADFDWALERCRNTRRLNVVALSVEDRLDDPQYYEQFRAICRLSKAIKAVTLIVPSAELGTPFNEEVERLRRLVDLASYEGARVSIRSQVGRLSEDPDTVAVLCDNVKTLGLTLDPSHYICGPHQGKSIDKLMKYVHHVHLRDTSKDALQVRVGQGEIDYGRLISQLQKIGYDRSLSVHITEMPDVDHVAELRKLRLLLESLL